MNCQEITNEIRRLRDKWVGFIRNCAVHLDQADLPVLLPIVQEAGEIEKKIREKTSPSEMFMALLRREDFGEYWHGMSKILYSKISGELLHSHLKFFHSFFHSMENFLAKYPAVGFKNIDEKKTIDFYNRVVRDNDFSELSGTTTDEIAAYLGKVKEDLLFLPFQMRQIPIQLFLNRYLKKEQTLEFGEIDACVGDYFGSFLRRGKIKITGSGELTAGDSIGAYLDGGEIEANSVGDLAFYNMISGKAHVLQAGHSLGERMRDGEIRALTADGFAGAGMGGGYLEIKTASERVGERKEGGLLRIGKAGSSACFGQTGGVSIFHETSDRLAYEFSGGVVFADKTGPNAAENATGGIVIIQEKADDVGSGANNTVFLLHKDSDFQSNNVFASYYFDKGTYFNFQGSKPKHYLDDAGLKAFHQLRYGMGILDSFSRINGDVTRDLKGKILVVREMPPQDFASGMTDGVVILEVPKASPKELALRISSQRRGGLILMRVRDPKAPEGTKLIDLEKGSPYLKPKD